MRKILLIITGSIASYKSMDLIRLLKKSGYEITPVLTKAAAEFVTPLLVSSLADNKTYTDLFAIDEEKGMAHINLSRDNDLILVAPASADIIGKMANGVADDLASNILLAANKRVIIAPAMNEKMWLNKANQKNLDILRGNAVKILTPKTDILACGEYGVGKMTDVQIIFDEVDKFFNEKKIFTGKKVIVTAGPTFEPIDPVRFIGNYSSGKQGVAIAKRFYELGAEVKLIAANINNADIDLPKTAIVNVKTADEMLKAIENNLAKTAIFVSCAAVADFKMKKISKEKIKKTKENSIILELVKNIDILKTISNHKQRPKMVVGFAAESENLIANAKIKIKDKNCDLIVANNIKDNQVFGSDYNQISIIDKKGKVESFDRMTKVEVAGILVKKCLQLFS